MRKMGVVEPSQTEWASPIVLVSKKVGSLRFCVENINLNSITFRDAYPILPMDECIESLGKTSMFSTLRANLGYWKIQIGDRDKNKTAVTSHHGFHRFVRIPSGLRNAPGTFQRVVDVVLATDKW